MRFKFKFVCIAAVSLPLMASSQGVQSFPLELRRCETLSTHEAVQECQKRGKAEGQEWERQMKERDAPPPPRLNSAENKLPINCFKRESTGEKICAN
jgi:hypothetical protein